MKVVTITRGCEVLVDDDDHESVASFSWQPVIKRGRVRSVQRVIYLGGGRDNQLRRTEKLHRMLLGVNDPLIQVDHRDGNPLNNQRSNLRLATGSQNQANRVAYAREKRERGGYLGVCFCKRTGRFAASIKLAGKNHWLGRHDTAEQAAAAYNRAAKELFGEFAAATNQAGAE